VAHRRHAGGGFRYRHIGEIERREFREHVAHSAARDADERAGVRRRRRPAAAFRRSRPLRLVKRAQETDPGRTREEAPFCRRLPWADPEPRSRSKFWRLLSSHPIVRAGP
jgi:hypothetical protein